jgi:copper chaperone
MIRIDVTGMTCSGCAGAVEGIVKNVDRDAVVRVDLASGRVEADTSAPMEALLRAIAAAGYGAKAAAPTT